MKEYRELLRFHWEWEGSGSFVLTSRRSVTVSLGSYLREKFRFSGSWGNQSMDYMLPAAWKKFKKLSNTGHVLLLPMDSFAPNGFELQWKEDTR